MKEKNLLVAGLSLNKLADLLISAKTTLTAILVSVGAPIWMVGWLVPIRESGALLPQVFISIYLRFSCHKLFKKDWLGKKQTMFY